MNLSNQFLLSMPQLQDPSFSSTLTYICEHDERGALGIIINRPLEIRLGDIMQEMDISVTRDAVSRHMVFEGGPVEPGHGLVVHPSATVDSWQGTHSFGHGVSISSSRDILVDIANGGGPERFMVILGHAGWGPGQLENEFAQNTWLSCRADLDILFDTPADAKLEKAADLLGVNFSNLSTQTGHA